MPFSSIVPLFVPDVISVVPLAVIVALLLLFNAAIVSVPLNVIVFLFVRFVYVFVPVVSKSALLVIVPTVFEPASFIILLFVTVSSVLVPVVENSPLVVSVIICVSLVVVTLPSAAFVNAVTVSSPLRAIVP